MRKLILVLAAGCLIAGAQPAHAVPKSKYFLYFIQKKTLVQSGQCRTIEKVMEGASIVLRAVATRFTQQVTYCWGWTKKRGHHLSHVQWSTGVWIAPWWDLIGEYVGLVGQTEWGGVGQKRAGRWQRGHFKVCVPWLNICQNTYPWTRVEAYGRGGYNTDGGT
jgi:hypothetical protein